MNIPNTIIFGFGVIVSLLAAFFYSVETNYPWFLPWMVGGAGMLLGLMHFKSEDLLNIAIMTMGLTLALYVIEGQKFNPEWLADVLFFLRVFVSHVLLAVGGWLFVRRIISD